VGSAVPCPYYQEYYKEGVMTGYRWYDNQHLGVAFPFGFGLSYTSFRYGPSLRIARSSNAGVPTALSLPVKNTGTRPGWAVAQVYVSLASQPGAPMPPRQLAGFAKVQLAPGKTRRVTIPLAARSFSYWSEAENGWRVAKGCSQIEVGASSRELPLRRGIEIIEGEAPGCQP
jgi:beta-glucosidase